MTARKTYTHAAWMAEAISRFGEDTGKWRFVCVSCGHVQSIDGIRERSPGRDFKLVVSQAPFACEGRWNPDVGCDWSLGGLFQLHTVEVVYRDGTVAPTFDFEEVAPCVG